MYLEKMKTNSKRYLHPNFTAALFTIAKTWKQPQCPSTDEWIKMRCIYTVGYYSAIKKDAIMSFSATWLQLESIILSEIRKKNTISLICGLLNMIQMNLSTKEKHKDTENRLAAAKGGVDGGGKDFIFQLLHIPILLNMAPSALKLFFWKHL